MSTTGMSEIVPPRKPSRTERVLIVTLALYAVAVTGLDTFRPFLSDGQSSSWPFHWYPIAQLGFQADNNGQVVYVNDDSPASAQGISPGQSIELSSIRPDRRAINKFVYVAHGSSYSMLVIDRRHEAFNVTVKAKNEEIGGWKTGALLIAQISALFFIGLCVYLVWRRATWSTWGLFLYGMWFNSGQYFVWYANLPANGLAVFDMLQAFLQALALTGFLAFASYFPDEHAPRRRYIRTSHLLAVVFVVLLVTGTLGFFNFIAAWRTEVPYRIYYVSTFVVYFLAAWAFAHKFRRLPEQRPRMRWIIAAGLVGLPLFLLADVYEATNLAGYLPFRIDKWIDANDWILNLMYGSNVLLPLAVVYTAFHHEVMSVRFVVKRAVILFVIFVISVVGLHWITSYPIEFIAGLRPYAVPLSLLLAACLALVHNPLHDFVEKTCAKRWYQGRRVLEELRQQLEQDDHLTEENVNGALVEETAKALWLECAALFCRRPGDTFVLHATYKWPHDGIRSFRGDHPWGRLTMKGPSLLTDSENPSNDPPGVALAVPVGHSTRHLADRIVVYGHHETRERIDPDEVRVVNDVSRSAALAYMRLELESLRRTHDLQTDGTEARG